MKKIIKFIKYWLGSDYPLKEIGKFKTVTPNPPPDPKPTKNWGTAVPELKSKGGR
jgi:hypothetical protein